MAKKTRELPPSDNPYACFVTTCPYCEAEDQLFVISGKFESDMPLREDGFSQSDAHNFNTSDETVMCMACDKKFELSEVTR